MLVLKIVDIILYLTMEIIRIRIVSVWSWKKISCSIRGDEAFWNPMADHEAIPKGKIILVRILNPWH